MLIFFTNVIKEVSSKEERIQILWDNHDAVLAGHFGIRKTYERIKQKYCWSGMRKDVEVYINQCEKCQRNKSGRKTTMGLVMVDVPEKPFDKLYMDIVVPLPMSATGNKYILSMVDDLTKFVEFVALPDQMASTIAQGLYENILCRYTIPRSKVTDNGSNFVGDVFKKLCKMFQVEKLQTTTYHPQANAVERQHSTLGNYLRTYTGDRPTNWDSFLSSAAHAYNNSVHVSTGYTPMQLLFGFCAEMPSKLTKEPEPLYTYDDYIQELRFKLQKGFSIARKNLWQAK